VTWDNSLSGKKRNSRTGLLSYNPSTCRENLDLENETE
jgi:hypothetical protein